MPLKHPIFKHITRVVDRMGVEAYVVGGYVRDYYLYRPSSDIDVVVVGSGVAVAEELGRELGAKVTIFKTYGTAMLRWRDTEVEFVGARKESYTPESRNPQVEPGTLEDDQRRRDFTINAMAWSVNGATFGELVDPFGGMEDLEDCIIRTPCEPDKTFSDDPLRMMRAVRFASQLGFDIDDETFDGICRQAERIKIITKERINVELNKILASPAPSIGLTLMHNSGLLQHVLPELERMSGVERRGKHAHKDNFEHTMKVLDNVAKQTDDLWLRWAALLHDIGKPTTKVYDPKHGWTFHQHEVVGSKMIPQIFRRLKLPMNEPMRFVQKMVFLHMRPIVLSEDLVTDSAVRRLLFEAGDDIEKLMTLCEADITSGIDAKVKQFLKNFQLVRAKMQDLEERDRVRNFQPPITGDIIMKTYNLPPCSAIGEIKEVIKNAILDGIIPNEYDAAYSGLVTGDKEVVRQYCRQSMEAMNTGLFTYFAHPDLIHYKADWKFYMDTVRPMCAEAKQCGLPLEINLLGIREGRHYPNRFFWEVAAEEGCQVILGCDAHNPQAVNDPKAEREALALAKELGLTVLPKAELRSIHN